MRLTNAGSTLPARLLSAVACSGPAIPVLAEFGRWRNPGPFISTPLRDAPPSLPAWRLLASPGKPRARFAGARYRRIDDCGYTMFRGLVRAAGAPARLSIVFISGCGEP